MPPRKDNTDDIKVLISEFRLFVESTVKTQSDHEDRLRKVEQKDDAIMQLILKLDGKLDTELAVLKGNIKEDLASVKERLNVFSGLQVALTSIVGIFLALWKGK